MRDNSVETEICFRAVYARRVWVSKIRPLQAVLARCRRQLFDSELDAPVASGVGLLKLVYDEDNGDEKWKRRAWDS